MPSASTLLQPAFITNDFINLKSLKFTEYEIIFRVNVGYIIKSINNISVKEQLLFQRFNNKNQQLNLMLIDSVFPIILADMALLVLLGKIKNLNDYLNSNERIVFPQVINDKIYFERKIMDFINGLLYGEVGGKVVWNGETDNRKIFCMKNNNGELEFFSIYDRKKLFEILISKMIFDSSDSQFINDNRREVKVCLKFKF
ncbi:MAG TPA: HpaII family restriction endonuclease [Paludibacter sp.]|nr:HpaII family restriction endonuclease [Paludibacter sp.]